MKCRIGMRRGELGHRAEVIAVPVRRDQVVDLREAGILDGGHDALGVARRGRAAVARVDQQRLAGRRDEQRRVAAFDVDDVDVQGLRRAALGGRNAAASARVSRHNVVVRIGSLLRGGSYGGATRLSILDAHGGIREAVV